MDKSVRIWAALLALMLLSGCAPFGQRGVPVVRGATPEEVTRKHVPNLARPAPTSIQIHGTRPTPNGALVVYTTGLPINGQGVVLARQRNGVWEAGGSTYGSSGPLQGMALDVNTTPLLEDGALAYGRVFNPAVAAVEATFDDGQTLRDERPQQMFGIVAPGARTACEVRALDANNVLVQRFDTTTTPQLFPNAQFCP